MRSATFCKKRNEPKKDHTHSLTACIKIATFPSSKSSLELKVYFFRQRKS